MFRSRPLTPQCIPFRTRRFNSLSAVPCIFGVCHYTPRMQGIRLLMTCAEHSCRRCANMLSCCLPLPRFEIIDSKLHKVVMLFLDYLPLLPIYLPRLHHGVRAVWDFVLSGRLDRTAVALYAISVLKTESLLWVYFRFRLATDTLALC